MRDLTLTVGPVVDRYILNEAPDLSPAGRSGGAPSEYRFPWSGSELAWRRLVTRLCAIRDSGDGHPDLETLVKWLDEDLDIASDQADREGQDA